MDEQTRAAFERLLTIAHSDTGQARRVADFILAWWNPYSLGRFDITDVFTLDRAIARFRDAGYERSERVVDMQRWRALVTAAGHPIPPEQSAKPD